MTYDLSGAGGDDFAKQAGGGLVSHKRFAAAAFRLIIHQIAAGDSKLSRDGGFATADAMFRYPDFFKVGIAESGNHDNREYEDDWGERYQGLLKRETNGKTNYDDQANQNLAKNLKGHLLLAHGTMDDNVPPYNTLLVVDALIKANKDFDLLMLPNQRHGYGNASNYMTRRRWDYFVRYLLGAEPPKNYELRPPAAPGP